MGKARSSNGPYCRLNVIEIPRLVEDASPALRARHC
jgi:hypothetical protein